MATPRVTIPIGTSDPMDLSSGLPLLPVLGAARAGISASSRSYKLIEFPLLIICVRLKITVYGGYGFGIVGPAVAFLGKNVNVDRANLPSKQGQLTLTFTDGLRMQAGAFVGAYVAAGVNASAEIWSPRPWYKFWANTWSNLFKIEKDFKVDLLDLMIKLITYLLQKKGNPATLTEDKQNKLQETKLGVKSFGMAGNSNAVRPDLTATPEVTAPLNLANYVPKLKEINLALAKIDGGISFGPTAHLQYPVTLNIDGFTVEGGVLGANSGDYRQNVQYRNGNQVTATGDREFNLQQIPTNFTTYVKYRTTVKLQISIHAQVKVAKFFCIGVNTPSLDLTYLLYRIPEPRRTLPVEGSVKTAVGGGCVLTPNMSLRFQGPGGSPDILTGDVGEGIVTVMNFQPQTDGIVRLDIEPEVPNFPKTVTISARSQSVTFPFTFPNQDVPTGNLDNPSEMASPSLTAPLQNYRVRARLLNGPTNLCWDFQAETPLIITNRVIRCHRFPGYAAAPAPPWDPDKLAGASLKADIDDPKAPSGGDAVGINLWFPYPQNQPGQTVPVTFTLVDENREPYGRSDVDVVIGQDRKPLNPTCVWDVYIRTRADVGNAPGGNVQIHWRSKGQPSGYSNRFYLLVDAGSQFGRTEFWLDVSNWS
jgi:hypothetical protein